jgi:tetratricopeptide (TPR) repeat protein
LLGFREFPFNSSHTSSNVMSGADYESFLRVGRRYLEQGDWESAETCFQKTLQYAPGNPEALEALKQIAPRRRHAQSVRASPQSNAGLAPALLRSAPTELVAPVPQATPLDRLFTEARVQESQPNTDRTRRAYEAAVSLASETVAECSRELTRAAAWALRQEQWPTAFDWFDLAASWSADEPATEGRAEAARQILVTRKADSREVMRVLSRWLTRAPGDAAAWEFAAEVLEWFHIPGRALAARARAARLRGNDPEPLAAWNQQMAERNARTRGRPNVLFYNVTNSGASALDPVLRKLLAEDFEYDLLGTPAVSAWLGPFLEGPVPFYHWTHSGPGQFQQLLTQPDCRCLCLYRDPRDILVSHALDPAHAAAWQGRDTGQVLADLMRTNFPVLFAQTSQWLALPDDRVLRFSFEEMKRDVPGLVRRIVDFLGLAVAPGRIETLCDEHSFERVAGRARGAAGATVRTGYMLRKGVAGDWRNHFDEELAALFVQHCGRFLIEWGYERDHAWASLHDARPATASATSLGTAPCLIEEGYRGFNLVRVNHQFIALAQSLSAWESSGHLLSAVSLSQLRQRVDTMGGAPTEPARFAFSPFGMLPPVEPQPATARLR